ncbi:MAG: flagellin [Paracoccaceae bacterium]
MSASVLTNSSAMIALQTLRSTNKDLAEVNSQISTGKKVATAKDSAAIFAISKIMESDVTGFTALNESLSLGQSTVAVASSAASSIGDLLNDIKGKIVSANEENVDRGALQTEIASLRDQITSIVDSAQFNGLNLINGENDGAGGFSVLSSLNRSADGSVTTGNITFDPAVSNLSATAGTDLFAGTNPATTVTAGTTAAAVTDVAGTAGTPDVGLTSDELTARGLAAGQTFGLEANAGGAAGATFQLGDFLAVQADGTLAAAGVAVLDSSEVDLSAATAVNGLVGGDTITLGVGFTTASYTVIGGDTSNDIVVGIRNALIEAGIDDSVLTLDTTTNAGELTIVNTSNESYSGFFEIERASGGLADLATLDVTSAAGASLATSQIETFIQNATNAQAQLGTIERRLDIQNDFTSKLIDSFKSGIGALVDADLEEASARLQALQVQQQLGVQALSIANQGPQNILALFR